MGKETLYRFELSFAGEAQGVGFLQGLDDTPIPFTVRDELFSAFDSLPAKDISSPDDSPVVFWFTEKGLQQYANVINAIIQELAEYDWQIVAMPITVETERSNGLSLADALYKDDLQVAFSRSDILEYGGFDYKEITGIDITKDNPLVFNGEEFEVVGREHSRSGCVYTVYYDRGFFVDVAASDDGYAWVEQRYDGSSDYGYFKTGDNVPSVEFDKKYLVDYIKNYHLQEIPRSLPKPPCRFNVGDKVSIPYISDCDKRNGLVGEVTWIHPYKYYPEGDSNFVWKYQMEIKYPDGGSIFVDPNRSPCGVVPEVELVIERSLQPGLDEVIKDASIRGKDTEAVASAKVTERERR